KNEDKFADRIIGLVSHFDKINIEDIPSTYRIAVDNCVMSSKQYAEYVIYRDKEKSEATRKASSSSSNLRRATGKFAKPTGLSSTYRVNTRQISNFLYPPYAYSKKKVDDKFVDVKDVTLLENDLFLPKNISEYSTKLEHLMKRLAS